MTNNFYRKPTEAKEKQVLSIEAQLIELANYGHREGINILEKIVENKSAK